MLRHPPPPPYARRRDGSRRRTGVHAAASDEHLGSAERSSGESELGVPRAGLAGAPPGRRRSSLGGQRPMPAVLRDPRAPRRVGASDASAEDHPPMRSPAPRPHRRTRHRLVRRPGRRGRRQLTRRRHPLVGECRGSHQHAARDRVAHGGVDADPHGREPGRGAGPRRGSSGLRPASCAAGPVATGPVAIPAALW